MHGLTIMRYLKGALIFLLLLYCLPPAVLQAAQATEHLPILKTFENSEVRVVKTLPRLQPLQGLYLTATHSQLNVGEAATLQANLILNTSAQKQVQYHYYVNNKLIKTTTENRLAYTAETPGMYTFQAEASIVWNPDTVRGDSLKNRYKSNVVTVSYTSRPPPVQPKLLLNLSPNPIYPNETCTVTAAITPEIRSPRSILYSFFVGPHVIRSRENRISCPSLEPGRHQVHATATIEQLRTNYTIKSNTIELLVQQPAPPPAPQKLEIDIYPNPVSANAGCTMTAKLLPLPTGSATILYTFSINDKLYPSQTNSIPCPRLEPGRHRVSVKASIKRTRGSNEVTSEVIDLVIEPPAVSPPPSPSERPVLSLDISPNPAYVGEKCTITAALRPAELNSSSLIYEFSIDGTVIRSSRNKIQCPQSGSGNYSVFSTVNLGNQGYPGTIQSRTYNLQIRERPKEPLSYVWPLVGIFSGILIYLILKPHPSMITARLAAGLDVRITHGKPAMQTVEPEKNNDGLQLVMTFDKGTQTLTDQDLNKEQQP